MDKTELVYQLVKGGTIYFLSRPRRFGKSLLLSTIRSYFEGRKDLFESLAMERLETEWNVYPVFHIDFNGHDFSLETELERTIEEFISSAEKTYGRDEGALTVGGRFQAVLAKAHAKMGRKAVVLVDEYDKPLLDVLDTPMEERNRNTLKAFYSIFKAADEHLQFVMLTGVTKFSQVSVFSGFNQPADISMVPRYDALCGITERELKDYFSEGISELARMRRRTSEEMFLEFKQMYDGYHFSESMLDIYNPFSILNALMMQKVDSYWFKTGSPTYLIRLMERFNEDMDEMTGKYYPTSSFIDYRADVERPLPMIYQSGYLTIKDYDPYTRSYRLDFPNNEVREGFVTMLASSYLKPRENTDAWVIEVANALRLGDVERFHRLMTSFLASVPYTERRKSDERERERYFHYTFYLILRMVSVYTVFTEKAQSEGRVDCVIETPEYIYIMEFKKDATAKEAMEQINEKGYAREYEADKRKFYKIGINFSSKTGTIDDWLVEEGIDASLLDDAPEGDPNDVVPGEAANVINGHGYVDLGLSVMWATCNVGADSPEDYGDYFAWGETKDEYTEENCETWWEDIGDIGGTDRDVAHVRWGSPWRMPTEKECQELLDNCDWEWTTLNGVRGYRVTGGNDNSIFLPAAGERGRTSLSGGGERGCYWSSSPYGGGTQFACYLLFDSGHHDWLWPDCGVKSVRPVIEKKEFAQGEKGTYANLADRGGEKAWVGSTATSTLTLVSA